MTIPVQPAQPNERPIDIWSTLVYHKLHIALSRFIGQCRLALVVDVQGEQEPQAYDLDDVLADQGPSLSDFLKEDDFRALYDRTGIIGFNNTHVGDPKRIRWYVKPAANCDGFDILRSWLQIASNAYFHVWQDNLIARGSTRWAVEHLQYSMCFILEGFIWNKLGIVDPAEQRAFPLLDVLDAIARVSRTIEEGHAPKGTLIFLKNMPADLCEFQDHVPISDAKHIGKLLALTKFFPEGALISDGVSIKGVSTQPIESYYLCAKFRRGGVSVLCNNENLCHVVDGEFRSPRKSHPSIIQHHIKEASQSAAIKVAGKIVEEAIDSGFGCTLVLDPNDPSIRLSGHQLVKPMSGPPKLVSGMASVDGAVHIDATGSIRGFSCLLDGNSLGADEVRSRGARYNSAHRFSDKHRNVYIIVVSADGPMTIFNSGIEIYSDPWSKPAKLVELPAERYQGVNLSELVHRATHAG